jgi:hypothetical protein
MRYFLITFSFKIQGEDLAFGDGNLTLSNETYPNYAGLIKTVQEAEPKAENITITNIIELTEQDYKDFTE